MLLQCGKKFCNHNYSLMSFNLYYIILIIGIYFIGCIGNSSHQSANKLATAAYIKNISSNWEFKALKGKDTCLEFSYLNGERLKTAQSFYLELLLPNQLGFIELSDTSGEVLIFKLFLNGKFVGEFSSNQKVKVGGHGS